MANPELELSHESDLLFANEGEYNFSAGFKQRFPIAGRLTQEKTVARVDVAMALAEVRDQERLLAGQVLELSRGLLVTQEKLKANMEIQNTIGKLIDVSKKRMQVAEASSTDVILARLELQKVTLAQAELLNQQEIATTALNGLLGRAPTSSLQMSGTISMELVAPAIIAEANDQALARRPDRQLAALDIDRVAAEIKLARAEKWEDWTIGFDYARGFSRFAEPIGGKLDNSVGLSVSIPLPLWNKSQGRVSEVQASQQRAAAELSALDLRITTEVQTAENQMRRFSDILRQYREESLRLAGENIAQLQKGYADGLTSITSVIQAQQQQTELRQSYLDTLEEFIHAKTDWETATASVPFNQTQN
jgi:cobalt-zinc-cadmium efflux system outer membrane protein